MDDVKAGIDMAGSLEVNNLSISFMTAKGEVPVIRDAGFSLNPGETLALVGDSGCGKSVLCKGIMKLLPASAVIRSGNVLVNGVDITDYREKDMCRLRGRQFSMIFQDPMTSLDPAMTVGAQIGEAVKIYQPRISRKDLRKRTAELMELAGLEGAADRMELYPHQLSGGQRQRIVIAIALAGNPDILFADEPTTALDVTVQAQILSLLKEIQRKQGMSMVFVSHDIHVVEKMADRVVLIREGRLVEQDFVKPWDGGMGTADRRHVLLKTAGSLLLDDREDRGEKSEVLLEVEHLTRTYAVHKKRVVRAVNDVSFQIRKGEILGLVGESGSGKSTIARCIMNIDKPEKGRITYKGIDLCNKKQFRVNKKMLQARRQLIFQDSDSSLNQRMKVCDIIAEPMKIQHIVPLRGTYRKEVEFQMRYVGLEPEYLDRYPSELSGGQRQRAAIARALTMEPELLIADEPVASLDVSSRAQIVELFRHLQKEHGFTFLFIAHDLALVRDLCDRVGVMHEGRLVEVAPVQELFKNPRHPYTCSLLAASLALGQGG